MVKSFQIARIPSLVFGIGSRKKIVSLTGRFGKNVVLITGSSSLRRSGFLDEIENALGQEGFIIRHYSVSGEPSPALVDQIVHDSISFDPKVVVAIGGGSVLDTGKAVSAMLPMRDSVVHYLEGVGIKMHSGEKIPFIAVPTTAGTGSEATKNAVLSEVGEKGFKKSLRHENFVPDAVLLDPELTYDCPPDITAASGMDCLTQLIESYVSVAASPFTDTLALPAIRDVFRWLPEVFRHPRSEEGRSAMLYAAFVSGITLANAGLGTVHGIASALGGLAHIPHGILCGTIMAEANRITIRKLLELDPESMAMKKYIQLAKLVSGEKQITPQRCAMILPEFLEKLTSDLQLPGLRFFGVQKETLISSAKIAENKNNPVPLKEDEIRELLLKRY
ncbi:MAG: iron-containing alcohol dehydrogenase [Bacteroidales bacterium]